MGDLVSNNCRTVTPSLADTIINRAREVAGIFTVELRSHDSVYSIYGAVLHRHYKGAELEEAKRSLWEALGYRGDPEGPEERAMDAQAEAA